MDDKKKISVIIPTFNEEKNVIELANQVILTLEKDLSNYNYELVFIDNDSKDKTRDYLRILCQQNNNIKAIFNAKNFGPFNSPYYGLFQGSGDCSILLCADFQDPIDMIPKFVREWENGYKIVCGIKSSSKENKIMYYIRSLYYNIIQKMSDVEQIEHFTGFALYDKSFLQIMEKLDDPIPFLRGIVAELGYKRKDIFYEQLKRKAGKTSFNFYKLYDAAMISFTSYTKVGLRFATFIGFLFSCVSFLVGFIYLIYKLLYWDRFVTGMAPLVIGIFLFSSVQLFFIGLIGEYILSINIRLMKRPLVIEAERINFG